MDEKLRRKLLNKACVLGWRHIELTDNENKGLFLIVNGTLKKKGDI